MTESNISILIIYTGGTIGMVKNEETGSYEPFDFNQILQEVPTLHKISYKLDNVSFFPPIDSSNVNHEFWIRLATLLKENYDKYDGFVVLHGTDTMSFTASALSFMLENQSKPVILTGSQLPIGTLRTDGKENLITALEIAAAQHDDKPMVQEVCIYFENKLYRGNRTTKYNADQFNAYRSDNYPILAEAGININFNRQYVHRPTHNAKLKIHTALDNNVSILKLFPGINRDAVEAVLSIKHLKAIVLETYGSGNAPTYDWFLETLKKATQNGVIIFNVTQCHVGMVSLGRYETSYEMQQMGIISGRDITTEAAISKLMFVLGQNLTREETNKLLQTPISGEMAE